MLCIDTNDTLVNTAAGLDIMKHRHCPTAVTLVVPHVQYQQQASFVAFFLLAIKLNGIARRPL